MELKSRLQQLLSVIISAITNSEIYDIRIGKLTDDETLKIDILVPGDKVGIVLGRADSYGLNPMKHAILRICKQTGFYYGYREVLIKIGELNEEHNNKL